MLHEAQMLFRFRSYREGELETETEKPTVGKRMTTDILPGDFVLHFRSEAGWTHDPGRRMAMLLKHALRSTGFRLVTLRTDVPGLDVEKDEPPFAPRANLRRRNRGLESRWPLGRNAPMSDRPWISVRERLPPDHVVVECKSEDWGLILAHAARCGDHWYNDAMPRFEATHWREQGDRT